MYNQFCKTLMTTTFLLFLLDKNNGERKIKRENKNTCEYERESCIKSCQKIDVQISFLFNLTVPINSLIAHMLDQMTYLLILEIIYSFFFWLITFWKFSDSKSLFLLKDSNEKKSSDSKSLLFLMIQKMHLCFHFSVLYSSQQKKGLHIINRIPWPSNIVQTLEPFIFSQILFNHNLVPIFLKMFNA